MKVWLIALFIVATVACLPGEVTREAISGEYEARYPFGTDRIALKDDGTFDQVISIEGTDNPLTMSGVWTFDSEARRVHLSRCLHPSDGFGNLRADYTDPLEGGCSYPVEREYFFGNRLRLGPDEGFPHRRVP